MSLKVEYVPITQLKANPRNPRVAPTSAILAIKNSIEKFGWTNPVLVQKGTNLIIAGHQRVKAAQLAGIKQVPVVYLDLNDVDSLAYNIADNKLAELTDWDSGKLSELLGELNTEIDLSVLGFDERELEKLLPLQAKEEDFEIPEIDKIHTDIRRGDIYKLGNHRLMCGDAISKTDVKQLMNGQKADMVFTDPPYGINIVKNGRIGKGVLAKEGRYEKVIGDDKPFNPSHLLNIAPKTILFGANHYANNLPTSAGWFVWDKVGREWGDTFSDAELLWSNIIGHVKVYRCIWRGMIKEGERGKRFHPTQKPIKLLKDIIIDYTNNPDIILDPYGGSGSTLIACEQTGRQCYMMEIDPRYCQVIINRWETYTDRKAEKQNA